MKQKLIGFLNVLMGACFGGFLGLSAYRLWDYHAHPDYYVMQSAPWYTSIIVWGIGAAVVITVSAIIRVLLNRKS